MTALSLQNIRKPAVIIAVVALTFVLVLDLGGSSLVASLSNLGSKSVPGKAIPALALLDSLLWLQAMMLLWDAFNLGRFGRWTGGPGMLFLTITVIISAIVQLIAAFVLLMLMVSIFMALPFGPLIYAAIWGRFDADSARALLSVTLTLRIIGGVGLVIYNQSLLTKYMFLALFFTILIVDVVDSFLLSMVPGLLCSITDAVGAIIGCIVALIWAIVLLIPSIMGTIRLIKLKA